MAASSSGGQCMPADGPSGIGSCITFHGSVSAARRTPSRTLNRRSRFTIGLAARLLYDHVPPGVDAFDPRNAGRYVTRLASRRAGALAGGGAEVGREIGLR